MSRRNPRHVHVHPHAGRQFISVACLLHATLLLTAPADRYSSPVYTVLFKDIPGGSQRMWGAVFLVAGIAGLAMWPPWRTFILAATLATWSLGLLAANFTGDSDAWSAPIWSGVVAVIVMWYGSRFPSDDTGG